MENELKIRNISINKCAKETGIPYGALYPIIKGKVKLENCTFATLKKLADFFHCSIDDFFNDFTDFTVFWGNEKVADVHIKDSDVFIERYTNHPAKQIFAKSQMKKFELGEILQSRCWDEHRTNIEKYLYRLGLTSYNVYKIVRKTHGVMFQDMTWFLFPGEKLSWDDVSVR